MFRCVATWDPVPAGTGFAQDAFQRLVGEGASAEQRWLTAGRNDPKFRGMAEKRRGSVMFETGACPRL